MPFGSSGFATVACCCCELRLVFLVAIGSQLMAATVKSVRACVVLSGACLKRGVLMGDVHFRTIAEWGALKLLGPAT